MRHVHAAAIRAQAEAELAALHDWPQPTRCRAGAHTGGPLCHDPDQPHDQGLDVEADLAVLTAVAALPRYRAGLHAIPLEVWANRR